MNTERFYLVTTLLAQEFTDQQIPQALESILTGIQNHINQPSNENLQQISQGLEQLKINIEESWIANVPQTWTPIIEAVGLNGCVGMVLYTRVRDIIAESQPLVNEALAQITGIKNSIDSTLAAFADIHKGFEMIGMQKEELEPGTAELSVLFPRHMFGEDWDTFLKEGRLIDRLIKTGSDIATGKPEVAKIRQISSSDPTLFLLASPLTVLFLMKLLNMILEAYERVFKIRKAKTEAEAAGMPKKVIREFEKEANNVINDAIDTFLKKVGNTELKGRKPAERNNLIAHMKDVTERIAVRIDRGMRIEGAAEAPEEDATLEIDGEEPTEPAVFNAIEEASEKILYFETPGEPILGLSDLSDETPLPEDEDEDED